MLGQTAQRLDCGPLGFPVDVDPSALRRCQSAQHGLVGPPMLNQHISKFRLGDGLQCFRQLIGETANIVCFSSENMLHMIRQ